MTKKQRIESLERRVRELERRLAEQQTQQATWYWSIPQQGSSGWTCGICGTWIPLGNIHTCAGFRTQVGP